MYDLERAAAAMSYRRMNNDLWGKPIGYALMTINLTTTTLTCHIKGLKAPLAYKSVTLDAENYLESIKFAESDCYHELSNPSSFEFLTPKDLAELQL